MNIYEKLLTISTELSTVAKNLEVGVGQSKYKAVGEADVLKAVKPLENKYKVYSYPVAREIIDNGFVEKTQKDGTISRQFYERIQVTYRFINIEKPDEFIDIVSYGDGIDSGDKSVGKAMTYADKYALMKAYKIITGDDPDQQASENYEKKEEKLKDGLVFKITQLGGTLEEVAKWKHKKVEELTNKDLADAIAVKEKR